MDDWRYQPLGEDMGLRAAWARAGAQSFSSTEEQIMDYLGRLDRDNECRVLVEAHDELLATLARTEVGMFVHGGRVDAELVGFVCVPPEHRGRRASVRLMEEYLKEARNRSAALSVLYSARTRLYRGVGYEHAGRRSEIVVPLRTLKVRAEEGIDTVHIRVKTEADQPSIERVYRGFAKKLNGYIDRSRWCWNYLIGAYKESLRPGFVFERDGEMSGYVIVTRGEHNETEHASELIVHDLGYSDAPTARAIIRFLAGHASTRSSMVLGGDWAHPLLDHIQEHWFDVRSTNLWMVRVVDFERAISLRGFSRCVDGGVVIRVDDSLFAENDGVWRIAVRDGKGSAVRTDIEPQAVMDITTFAPIYTGFMSASQMAHNGRLTGEQSAIEMLDGLFASTTPAMADDF